MSPSGQLSAIGHSTDVLEGIWPRWSKVGVLVEKALHSDGILLYQSKYSSGWMRSG